MNEMSKDELEIRRNDILDLMKRTEDYNKECDELLELALEKQENEYIAFAYIYKALYEIRNDYKTVVECLEFAKEYLDFIRPSRPLQLYYNLYNSYHSYINDTQNSIQDCLKGLEVSFQLEDKVAVAVFYNNIGEVFLNYEDFEDAYTYFLKAYEVMKECESIRTNYKIAILSNLGQSCMLLHHPQEELHYIKIIESEDLTELNYRHELYMLYLSYYTKEEDYENAKHYYDLLVEEHYKIDRNKALTFDYLFIMCKSMIQFRNEEESKKIFELLENTEDELLKTLKVQKIKVEYYKQFGSKDQLEKQYRKYYDNCIDFDKHNNLMRANALQIKLSLAKIMHENAFVQQEVKILEDEVNRDNLTGLYNRKYLNMVQMNMDKNTRVKKLCFIMLDVDYFKEYNDTYGHMEGDKVLKNVAKCMRKISNDDITVYRYGGDEFACLCVNREDDEIESLLDDIRVKFQAYRIAHSHSLCSDVVTLSIGYCNEEYHALLDVYTLIDKADQALYKSKEKGRNTYSRYFLEE